MTPVQAGFGVARWLEETPRRSSLPVDFRSSGRSPSQTSPAAGEAEMQRKIAQLQAELAKYKQQEAPTEACLADCCTGNRLAAMKLIKHFASTWLLRRRMQAFMRNSGVEAVQSHLRTMDSIKQELDEMTAHGSINATNLMDCYLTPLRPYFEQWMGSAVDPSGWVLHDFNAVTEVCHLQANRARALRDEVKARIEAGAQLQPMFAEELPVLSEHLAQFMCQSRSVLDAVKQQRKADPAFNKAMTQFQKSQTPIKGQRFGLASCFFAPLQRLTSWRMLCQSLDKLIGRGLTRSSSGLDSTSWTDLIEEFTRVEQAVDRRYAKHMELRKIQKTMPEITINLSGEYTREFIAAIPSWRRNAPVVATAHSEKIWSVSHYACQWVALIVLSDMILVVSEPTVSKPRTFTVEAVYEVPRYEITRLADGEWKELLMQFGFHEKLSEVQDCWPPRATAPLTDELLKELDLEVLEHSLSEQHSRAAAHSECLQRESETLKHKNDMFALETQNHDLEARNAHLQQKVASLEDKSSRLESENHRLKSRLDELLASSKGAPVASFCIDHLETVLSALKGEIPAIESAPSAAIDEHPHISAVPNDITLNLADKDAKETIRAPEADTVQPSSHSVRVPEVSSPTSESPKPAPEPEPEPELEPEPVAEQVLSMDGQQGSTSCDRSLPRSPSSVLSPSTPLVPEDSTEAEALSAIRDRLLLQAREKEKQLHQQAYERDKLLSRIDALVPETDKEREMHHAAGSPSFEPFVNRNGSLVRARPVAPEDSTEAAALMAIRDKIMHSPVVDYDAGKVGVEDRLDMLTVFEYSPRSS